METSGYQIKTVSRLTGIPKNTLIAWERRYDLVAPVRLKNGYRIYSSQDLLIINRVKSLLEQGFKISEAALLVQNEDMEKSDALSGEASNEEELLSLKADLIEAIGNYDISKMEDTFTKAEKLPLSVLIDDVVVPVSSKVGENWASGKFNVAQEHFSTGFIKEKLFSIFRNVKQEPGKTKKTFLLACVENERHEIGLLALGIKLRQSGCRVIYLGTDLPAAELGTISMSRDVTNLCLSIVNPIEEEVLGKYLEQLRSVVTASTNVYVGGRAALNFAPNTFSHLRVDLCYSMADLLDKV